MYGADLTEAKLPHANLERATFGDSEFLRADLTRANLNTAHLVGASLRATRLHGADLRNANLCQADLAGSDLSCADLSGAELYCAKLIGTNLANANLTGSEIYGISAWDVNLEAANQSNLIIRAPFCGSASLQVDNLEVAQFIYLLLHSPKIRSTIDSIGAKAVLILGRFSQERKPVLEALRNRLRCLGYLPILFDFQGPESRDTHETILTLASLARFIIADITEPRSVPQELGAIIPNLPSVPVQPILQVDHEPWGMFDHFARYPWVLPVLRYSTTEALLYNMEFDVMARVSASRGIK